MCSSRLWICEACENPAVLAEVQTAAGVATTALRSWIDWLRDELLPTADGQGRVPALEILLPDDAVRNLIRQGKVEQVYSVMQTGGKKGMNTMEQALAELVLRGIITQEVAANRSSRPEMLAGLLGRASGEDGGATPLRIAEA